MIHASEFLEPCKKAGLTLFTGTPCSYLKPFINYVIDDADLEFVETTNEGDAVALACGAWLGGRRALVMFQNSGLGNAVNPLTSLSHTMKMPFVGIVTLRGEPGGAADEPQHELMGQITTQMLETMQIPWAYFPKESDKIQAALDEAFKICDQERKPFFFVMQKGAVEAYELKAREEEREIQHYNTEVKSLMGAEESVSRTDALKTVHKSFENKGVLLATTGKTGRELFEINDSANNLYMVGSMGCALPLGLGVSLTDYQGKVGVIDGDGALLMRMGNMALAGQMKPTQLVHILLDNGVHDSTGGQKTFSESVDFANIAAACGYDHVYEVDSAASFDKAMKESMDHEGLAFIRFIIKPGSPKDLGRPTVTPYDVAQRLKDHISESHERNNQ